MSKSLQVGNTYNAQWHGVVCSPGIFVIAIAIGITRNFVILIAPVEFGFHIEIFTFRAHILNPNVVATYIESQILN